MPSSVLRAARKYGGAYSGALAWGVQRATGLLLLFYLFLHVRTVRELRNGEAAFDAALAAFRSPFFKMLEIALLGVVILHALNGVRITLLDLGVAVDRQRRLFWILAVGLGGALFLAGAIPIFLYAVLGLGA